jgi:hypothetical protein
MTLLLCVPLALIALMLLNGWRTDKKLLSLLITTAEKLGISKLIRIQDLQIQWLAHHIVLAGSWNHKIPTIETSAIIGGLEIILQLNVPSSTHMRIRRVRNFHNYDLLEYLTKTSFGILEKEKASIDDFEIISDDPAIANHIFNHPDLLQVLNHCIRSQYDELNFDKNQISIKACCYNYSLFSRVNWKELEKKLIQMWLLVTSIAAFPQMNLKTDINLVKCPYCRGMLNEGLRIVRCNECHTMFHESCWQENGQCAIFRCYGSKTEAIDIKQNNQTL